MIISTFEITYSSFARVCLAMLVVLALYRMSHPRSIVAKVPGPPSPSWIFGHMLQLLLPPQYGSYEFQWQKVYGPVYRIKGCFGQERLVVSDPLALQCIFNPETFDHAPALEKVGYLIQGPLSLSYLKGKDHIYKRAWLTRELAERLETLSAPTVNVWDFIGTATLSAVSESMDIFLGLGKSDPFKVVFGIPLQEMGEELTKNFHDMVMLACSLSPASILLDAIIITYLPASAIVALSWLPTRPFTILRNIRDLASKLGYRLVREKLDSAQKGVDMDKDIYGLLLARNMHRSQDALSEDEIAGQTALMLTGGQDTAANALSFALMELARNPALQDNLRAEIHSVLTAGGERIAYDTMPLLNALIKASVLVLRFYPGLPLLDRICLQDTNIPLKNSITTTSGERITAIAVRKGQIVTPALASYNRLESRWGSDAHEFRPSRWIDGTVVSHSEDAVGPYANLGTFLGGPRTCLGWRFAILEMQVILCTVISKFSFQIPPGTEADMIGRPKFANVLTPALPNGDQGVILHIGRIV
ncbi:Cytochrome P450 [Mycena venus]|uniref:Cytochrome P450 n=1 Tax=Mycena venus TaxID=2733690 RepID=A0A8H7CG20_9AGAR|nr:Cytochrome P450 [Mycena venus]